MLATAREACPYHGQAGREKSTALFRRVGVVWEVGGSISNAGASACRPEDLVKRLPFLGELSRKSQPLVPSAYLWCPKQVRLPA